jgi:hypothetical protein
MRTLEMLLLVADLVALGVLAVPRLRDASWWRLSAIVAMAFAFAQVVTEGPRWQMVPAYGLTLLCFVVAITKRFGVARYAARRTSRPIMA